MKAYPALILVIGLVGLFAPPVTGGDGNPLAYAAPYYTELDPAKIRTPNDERLVRALFDGLTAIDAKSGRVVPAAAASWEEGPNGKVWTFRLRPTATWSDGSPVLAKDFVQAWRRLIDPYEPSRYAWMLRRIEGAREISDGERAMTILYAARKDLEKLAKRNVDGIPGSAIQELVLRTGVRPYAEAIDDQYVRRFLRWGDDEFSHTKAEKVIQQLKDARKTIKKKTNALFDRFGVDLGVVPKTDHLLEVRVEGRCPWLPALVARAPFVPLHAKTLRGYQDAFEPGSLITNGAYALKGRGAKARPGEMNPMSVVHLEAREEYDGPRPATSEEVLCFTGQGPEDDLRRLRLDEIQWIAEPNAEEDEVKDAFEKHAGLKRHPEGSVLCIRFRCDRPPFDDKEIRRAFALVVDRKNLRRALWPKPDTARRLVPPHIDEERPPMQAEAQDLKAAKRILKKAGIASDDFPWVELYYLERPDHEEAAERLLRMWEKGLGLELGQRIETPEAIDTVLRSGAYGIVLTEIRGTAADPEPFISGFAASHPQSGLGWKDERFERLVAAASDVDVFLEAGDAALEGLPKAIAGQARGASSPAAKDALRRALLRAAEARLLEEAVVVPLLFPKRAEVRGTARGMGDDAAWQQPGFFGEVGGLRR